MINLMPGSIPCEPISCEYGFSKEPLNFGVSILAPVSSVPGSSSFFFLQPLLEGKVFASAGILLTAQLFLFLADRVFGLESMPIQKGPAISPEQTVRMSFSDLQEFLASVSRDNVQPPTGVPSSPDQTSGLVEETPEIPLVFSLAVWSDFSNNPYGPVVFFILPLFAFPGVRGALPLLILELLTTIFVRSVVPPQTTGSKPLTDSTTSITNKLPSLHFSPEDLLNLLNRFSKHFGT